MAKYKIKDQDRIRRDNNYNKVRTASMKKVRLYKM